MLWGHDSWHLCLIGKRRMHFFWQKVDNKLNVRHWIRWKTQNQFNVKYNIGFFSSSSSLMKFILMSILRCCVSCVLEKVSSLFARFVNTIALWTICWKSLKKSFYFETEQMLFIFIQNKSPLNVLLPYRHEIQIKKSALPFETTIPNKVFHIRIKASDFIHQLAFFALQTICK